MRAAGPYAPPAGAGPEGAKRPLDARIDAIVERAACDVAVIEARALLESRYFERAAGRAVRDAAADRVGRLRRAAAELRGQLDRGETAVGRFLTVMADATAALADRSGVLERAEAGAASSAEGR